MNIFAYLLGFFAAVVAVVADVSKQTSQSILTPSIEHHAAPIHSQRLSQFKIVDSTLREGEQFSSAFFTPQQKFQIAVALNHIGVDYIELTNPMSSEQSRKDVYRIANLPNLQAKIVTHCRCVIEDVKQSIDAGVHGVNLFMATSKILRESSHGQGIDEIIDTAGKVIRYAKERGAEVRFSCEDSFRSDPTDLLKIYAAVSELGVDRVGLADTVGIACPLQVYETVRRVREHVGLDIEFHAHDDTGCAVANSFVAVQAGATHIDTCVLGIGERNGITPLGAFLGRMYTLNKNDIKSRFNLEHLHSLEQYVADAVKVNIPFNNCITGSNAFTHKAGVHAKAVITNPAAYEVIDPADFGLHRNIEVAHHLIGWHMVLHRARSVGIDLSEKEARQAAVMIRNAAAENRLRSSDVDAMLRHLSTTKEKSKRVQRLDFNELEELARGRLGIMQPSFKTGSGRLLTYPSRRLSR